MSGPDGNNLGLIEALGLRPIGPAAHDALEALIGTPFLPRTRWGPSSLHIVKPWISLPTWLGCKARGNRLWIYNLFNREQPPRSESYSVRVTFARDFMGGRFTYDGHQGTDFAAPVGTPVVAAAPGSVLRVHNDFYHGGLKVCVDHGGGYVCGYYHLSRTLVVEGELVERGRVLGLSGASGMEFVLFFPWIAPHLHYDVWLDGTPVDPFALEGEVSLWRQHNDPVAGPAGQAASDSTFEPSAWSPEGVEASIEACRDPKVRDHFRTYGSFPRRAAEVLCWRNYRSPLFREFPSLYRQVSPRRPFLDLPFRDQDAAGVLMPETA
jgi:hypothetical protein